MSVIEVPVLIVGSGPVGLGLSLDLGGRGIGCLVIEKLADITSGIKINPRAAAITPRTMEFCRRWGVANAVQNAGFPEDYELSNLYCTSLDGYLLARNRFPSMKDRVRHPFSPETRERCPQIWFDPILKEGTARFPCVQVKLHHVLESFEDTGDGVIAQVKNLDNDEILTVKCQYMVACDGSASMVRTNLGIKNTGAGSLGHALNAVVDIPDFMRQHKMGQAERYYFIDRRGCWGVLTVIDAKERWRFTLMDTQDPEYLETEDFDGFVRRALGSMPYTVVAKSSWQRRETIAEQYKKGRVLLAGDAAHSMGPDLGIGMNTGASDAFDLGWKIEATLKGWGGPGLLDSYEIERQPSARRNAEASTETYYHLVEKHEYSPLVTEPGPEGDAARKKTGEQILGSLKVGWDSVGLAMGYIYENSPICIPDGSPPPEDKGWGHYVQSSRPGGRAPHAWLADGRSTLDLFGHGFVLMRFGTRDVSGLVEAAARRKVPFTVVDIDDESIKTLYEQALVLVRPDGHVAWRSNDAPADAMAIIDRIRGAA